MQFISCDWGTSSFRLRLIDQASSTVLAEIKSAQGIAATHELWKQSGQPDRISFFLSFLSSGIASLPSQYSPGFLSSQQHPAPQSLDGVPLIISGMASSSIGMIELPYKECPFSTNGHDLGRHQIPATSTFPHPVTLISGVRTTNDVMRGEETLLVGAAREQHPQSPHDPRSSEQCYIFPGTHSKHVRVRAGIAIDLKTYMTGEFFSLLSQKSILNGSITLSDKNDPVTDIPADAFIKGVDASLKHNILHNAFVVRTHHLFGKMSKQENAHFLSGLLIGAELRELLSFRTSSPPTSPSATSPSPASSSPTSSSLVASSFTDSPPAAIPLTLVSSGHLRTSYEQALHTLGFTDITTVDADQALINAHCKMLL